MSSPSRLVPLCAGLALGSAATWAFLHLHPIPPTAASALPAPRSSLPAGFPAPPPPPPRLADPEATTALDAFLALPALGDDATESAAIERADRLRALLTLLPSDNLAQLLAATADRRGRPEDRLRRIAFDAWAELAAPAAARWAAALETSSAIDATTRAWLTAQAVITWSRSDLDAAYAWAAALPADLARHVCGELLADLAATDPRRALALARSGDADLFTAVKAGLFHVWLAHDPAAAFATLGEDVFSQTGDASRGLPRDFARWAARDPQAALIWFNSHASAHASQLVDLLDKCADCDPPINFAPFADTLTEFARKNPGDGSLGYFFRNWLGQDSTVALRWLDTLPDAAVRAAVLAYSVRIESTNHPERALGLILLLPPGDARDQAYTRLFALWSLRSPDAALAWLENPASGPLADSPAAQIARAEALPLRSPEAALELWGKLASDDDRRQAAPGLARNWAISEPDAAAAWLFTQIPEGLNFDEASTAALSPAESEAMSSLLEPYTSHFYFYSQASATWIARDPAGFVAWAESLPSATQQRSALSSLTWTKPSGMPAHFEDSPDPSARLAVVATLKTPDLRDALLRDSLAGWTSFDAVAARRWAASHGAESLLPAAKNAP